MNMKISITKKIMGMVVLPILFICLVVGIISANIMAQNITDEIEVQLKQYLGNEKFFRPSLLDSIVVLPYATYHQLP